MIHSDQLLGVGDCAFPDQRERADADGEYTSGINRSFIDHCERSLMNILIFGPNGSGKGTQGALVKHKYGLEHIESGAIFRQHIGGGTELGKQAKAYIERGELVPDEITIPMVLDVLGKAGASGWLLDGFPRSIVQAQKLWRALQEGGVGLDHVIEILLPREVAKARIMGRRLCAVDPNHPNNIGIPAIAPEGDRCRVCGGMLSARADDQDEEAINKRHDIYYDTHTGTVAACNFFKKMLDGGFHFVELDGERAIGEIRETLFSQLGE
jgi:adenylate kinase